MDSGAFERLMHGSEQEIASSYRVYRPLFVRFITRAFRCLPDRAEEIYPEAFSIVYFNIRKGKLTAPLKSTIQTYLNSTGWNLYHRRYLDKYQRDKLTLDHIDHVIDTTSIVDEALMQKERAIQVRQVLEKIGDPCKSILTEIYLQESSYKDIAVMMDVPESTLRKRKFDCLAKLRKLMILQKTELG